MTTIPKANKLSYNELIEKSKLVGCLLSKLKWWFNQKFCKDKDGMSWKIGN